MMTQNIKALKFRIHKLEQKDSIANSKIIAKLKRQVKKLES